MRWDPDCDRSAPPPGRRARRSRTAATGALLPGAGFVAAGYRKIGWTLLGGLLLLVAAAAFLATGRVRLPAGERAGRRAVPPAAGRARPERRGRRRPGRR